MKALMTILTRTFILCFALLEIFGCGDSSDKKNAESGKLSVYTGLPPIAFLASKVGGELVNVKSILPDGKTPHDYSPSTIDIKRVNSAKLFLTTRMIFEKNLTKPLVHSKVKIVDISSGVARIAMVAHDHSVDKNDVNHSDQHSEDIINNENFQDPHIWLSLVNDRIIVDNICQAFSAADPAHAADFRRNADLLKTQLTEMETEIRKKLAIHAGAAFYVYHPAFGYFAAMTGLKQISIETGGQELSPAHFADVIKQARANKVKVIFVQPQFNQTSAKALADAIGGDLVELDPLAFDLLANFSKMTNALSHGFVNK